MNLFFSTGEASGDRYAAELAEKILEKSPATIYGIGGPKLQAQTNQKIISSADWGALGIYESLKVAPRIWRRFLRAKSLLRTLQPGVFIPIDFGFVNIPLAKFAKKLGWKVIYFIPPGSWRKTKQGADLPLVTHAIITPFPWSADLLNQMGANAHYFGHPLKQMVCEAQTGGERSGIAVLPGSRHHEIEANLPEIAKTLENFPNHQILIAVSSNLSIEDSKRLWQKFSNRPAQFSHNTYEVLSSAEAAIVCSGTATLESALCNCPTVVVYRGTKAMEIEFKIRKPKFDFISLPNILLNRPLLPELIQDQAEASKITQYLSPLLQDSPTRKQQIQGFAELSTLLGSPNALDLSVQFIAEYLKKSEFRN